MFSRLSKINNGVGRAINVLSAISDLAIASVLIVLLHRSQTQFKTTETLVNNLIKFTIGTGLVTSLCAFTSLITVS